MSRKERIERIVIGSLLANKRRYLPSVRSCVTEDMFSDIRRDLYRDIIGGRDLDLLCLKERYPNDINDIVGMIVDDDFDTNLWEYNLNQRLFSEKPMYSRVTFDDYVSRLIRLSYEQLA